MCYWEDEDLASFGKRNPQGLVAQMNAVVQPKLS